MGCNFILFALTAVALQAQTITLEGTVLTVSGAPVAGATCQFKTAGNKAVTDAQGKYSFSGSAAVRRAAGYSLSLAAAAGQLSLRLDRDEKVGIDLFNVAGKLVGNLFDGPMAAGTHRIDMGAAAHSRQLYLLRMRLGQETAWHKLTLQGEFAAVTAEGASEHPLFKTEAAVDSLFCTSDDFHGGLAKINGRSISSYSGIQNFRMFSSDPAWKVCAPPITFTFDSSAGVTRYKQLIPNWVTTEQEVLMEVCQSVFKTAGKAKKYSTYAADIKTSDGVAATGGNHLYFNTGYIENQPNNYAGWWEVVGVQTHEATHSFQPYYNTAGADGFGESMPDAVRALNGFFKWPAGTKCNGAFTDPYQGGGQYWYFIEMKHPGFLTSVWQQATGDISARTQSITGESLDAMVSECKTTGMPR